MSGCWCVCGTQRAQLDVWIGYIVSGFADRARLHLPVILRDALLAESGIVDCWCKMLWRTLTTARVQRGFVPHKVQRD